jgi:RHS repeat-associated protein
MLSRSFNAPEYKYGFNGKEKDDEINVGGGSYDFGARIYDSRLGRWLSIDPLQAKYPDLSTYNFVANNPLRFQDPTGEFLLDVHQRATKNALELFGNKILSPNVHGFNSNASFLDGLRGNGSSISPKAGVTNPDIWHSGELGTTYDANQHFDNMKFPQIMGNIARIQSMLNSNVESFNKGDKLAYELGHDVGVAIHAIQDLYSHSNYVELYIEANPKAMEGDVNKIPTIDEALNNPAHAKFALLIKTKLKTGEYPGSGDGNSHKAMNHDIGEKSNFGGIMPETKDKKVSWNSKAAEALATKATVKVLKDVKEKVNKK